MKNLYLNISVSLAFILTIIPLPSLAKEPGSVGNVKIQFGRNDPVCREVANLANNTPASDFWEGSWRAKFGNIDWQQGENPTNTAKKATIHDEDKYLQIDIDNDGIDDIVLMHTNLFTSIFWDWLYVLNSKQFTVAQQEGTLGKVMYQSPMLNPQNEVKFSNGKNAAPVELHIWKHENINYILMKEHFFAKKKPNLPSSFFVGKLENLEKQLVPLDGTFNKDSLTPKLICHIVMN